MTRRPDEAGLGGGASTVFAGAIDRRPAMIVRVADADDVARVIAHARETGSELAVRGGGHSPAGHGASEGGIVLDVSALSGLEIDVIASFVAEAEAAPEELSTIASVMPAPPLPFLAPEHHGRLVVMAALAYAGDVEAGERAVAPFRALATPIADMLRPMPYAGMFPPEEDGSRPVAVVRTGCAEGVDRRAAETILERIERSTAATAVAQLRVLSGAMAGVPADATAFAHRGSRIMVNVGAIYENAEERPAHAAWVTDLSRELTDGDAGAYAGFLADEGEERVRAAYPAATWDRLAEIKASYDPDNVFRLNQNIPPAAS